MVIISPFSWARTEQIKTIIISKFLKQVMELRLISLLLATGRWNIKIADHGTGTVFEKGSKLYVQLTNKNNIKIEYELIYNNGGTTLSGEYKGKTTTSSSFNFSFQ